MLKLCNEKSDENRNLLSMKLSKTLLQKNGFHAYFEYLSVLTDDPIERMNAFCKVIFSRPLIFLSDIVNSYIIYSFNIRFLYCFRII